MPKSSDETKTPSFHAVLLAGGSGTRLWPLSTSKRPKQFLRLFSNQTLLEETLNRLQKLTLKNTWVVAGQSHEKLLKEELPNLSNKNFLLEPQAKNTLAALTWVAFEIVQKDPQALLAVFPADHYIPKADWDFFHGNLSLALNLAEKKECLVTFGIKPKQPSTDYGYLEAGKKREGCFVLESFHEKPNLKTAQSYLENDNFFWNSGMFVWKAGVFLEELKKASPKVYGYFEKFKKGKLSLEALYQALPSLSVDHGIMEKSDRVLMVPADFAWSDVGGFGALAEILKKDEAGNGVRGKVLARESSNNLVLNGREKPLVLLGVEGLVVVEGQEAILIASKEAIGEIRSLKDLAKALQE